MQKKKKWPVERRVGHCFELGHFSLEGVFFVSLTFQLLFVKNNQLSLSKITFLSELSGWNAQKISYFDK